MLVYIRNRKTPRRWRQAVGVLLGGLAILAERINAKGRPQALRGAPALWTLLNERKEKGRAAKRSN